MGCHPSKEVQARLSGSSLSTLGIQSGKYKDAAYKNVSSDHSKVQVNGPERMQSSSDTSGPK